MFTNNTDKTVPTKTLKMSQTLHSIKSYLQKSLITINKHNNTCGGFTKTLKIIINIWKCIVMTKLKTLKTNRQN